MSEEMFVEVYKDNSGNQRVFKCVKSQLWKTGGRSPITNRLFFPEMAASIEAANKESA